MSRWQGLVNFAFERGRKGIEAQKARFRKSFLQTGFENNGPEHGNCLRGDHAVDTLAEMRFRRESFKWSSKHTRCKVHFGRDQEMDQVKNGREQCTPQYFIRAKARRGGVKRRVQAEFVFAACKGLLELKRNRVWSSARVVGAVLLSCRAIGFDPID